MIIWKQEWFEILNCWSSKGPAYCPTLTSRSKWQSWPGNRRRWGRWWWGQPSWRSRSPAGPDGNWEIKEFLQNFIIFAVQLHLFNIKLFSWEKCNKKRVLLYFLMFNTLFLFYCFFSLVNVRKFSLLKNLIKTDSLDHMNLVLYFFSSF